MDNSVPIGIDFGSSKSIQSFFCNSQPTILLSDDSSREFHNIIVFTKERRYICTLEAFNAFRKNFANSIMYPLIFLAPKLNQHRLQWNFTEILLNKQGIVFQIKNGEEKYNIEIVQAIAMILENLKQQLEKEKEITNKKMKIVLGIPPFFSNYERNIIFQASHLANCPVTQFLNQNRIQIEKLLHESSAIGFAYVCSRKQEFLQNTKRYVIFIDIGFTKTGIFLICFEEQFFNVIKTQYDEELGVSNIDIILMQYICARFAQINNCENLANYEKYRAKLIQQVQNLRKVLSANSEATISIENFYLDLDLQLLIQREELQKLIEKAAIVKQFPLAKIIIYLKNYKALVRFLSQYQE